MINKKHYTDIGIEDLSRIVEDPQYSLFFNNGQKERQEEGTLRVLSLFSGSFVIIIQLQIKTGYVQK